MVDASKFWNRLADKYARQPVEDEEAYQHKLAETRAYFTPESRVLEFGCGTGSTAIAHSSHVKSIHALDFSERMIEIASEKANADGITNVSFEVASIENLTDTAEPYDVIMGMSILHLLQNKTAAINKVFSLLKPGGVFVSSTICVGDLNFLISLMLPVMRTFGLAPFVAAFSTDDLKGEIEGAGFVIEKQWRPAPGKAIFIVARRPS